MFGAVARRVRLCIGKLHATGPAIKCREKERVNKQIDLLEVLEVLEYVYAHTYSRTERSTTGNSGERNFREGFVKERRIQKGIFM